MNGSSKVISKLISFNLSLYSFFQPLTFSISNYHYNKANQSLNTDDDFECVKVEVRRKINPNWHELRQVRVVRA